MRNPTPIAPRGTVAADPDIKIQPYKKPHKNMVVFDLNRAETPLEADWAERHLQDVPTVIRPAKRDGKQRKTRIWEDVDHTWWRNAGSIWLVKGSDGVYRFEIKLARGAVKRDLEFFEGRIADAKKGLFLNHGWKEDPSSDGGPAWFYSASRHYLLAPQTPWNVSDRESTLLVCMDPRCTKSVHDASGDWHYIDEISTEAYDIEVVRFIDDEGEDDDYKVSVEVHADYMTPAEIASFTSDLQWLSETCRRANTARIDPVEVAA